MTVKRTLRSRGVSLKSASIAIEKYYANRFRMGSTCRPFRSGPHAYAYGGRWLRSLIARRPEFDEGFGPKLNLRQYRLYQSSLVPSKRFVRALVEI